jgi:hypothetical protein
MSEEIPVDCRLPEYHFKHICKLRKKGMMREIQELAAEAAYRCEKCHAEAKKERNLCQPGKL